MTGGGPGAMKAITDLAKPYGILTGASFLELDSRTQENNLAVDFYQTFQFNARHLRQRWFEIASLHIFLLGGLGTMEEIGLTLTDMKLGVIDPGPLVFWGSQDNELYWKDLGKQLARVADSGRGPDWIKKYVLITDNPDEVIAFYQEVFNVS